MDFNSESVVVLPSREAGLTLLEQLHANTQKKCIRKGHTAPTMLAIDRVKKQAIYVEANCKQWDCPACGARNASQWVARIINGVKFYGGEWFFMTITAHRLKRGQEKSLANLRDGWRKVYNRILRKFGKFHYIKICEAHKDGSLHMHVITDVKLPYKKRTDKKAALGAGKIRYTCRYLKNICAESGIGYQADYQPLENVGLAAWYVAKYLSKSIANADFPKGLRRIQPNQNFPRLPDLRADLGLAWVYVTNKTDMLLKTYNLWVHEDIVSYDAINQRDITTDDWERIIYCD